MKESYWAYLIIALGVTIITVMILIQRMTITTEENYYLSREILESSMIDAVDYGTYRTTGRVVMSEQKFIEVFVRRFAQSVTNNKEYELSFYDIYEDPPKATVLIRTNSGSTAVGSESFDVSIDTTLSGIIETIYGVSDTPPSEPQYSSSSSSSSSNSESSKASSKKSSKKKKSSSSTSNPPDGNGNPGSSSKKSVSSSSKPTGNNASSSSSKKPKCQTRTCYGQSECYALGANWDWKATWTKSDNCEGTSGTCTLCPK